MTPPATATGGGSTSSAYEPVIVTGFKGAVNFVGGFTNAFISEINGGVWTSGGGMAYMHISGNPVPQIPAIPIWGDYDTSKYSSWIGSTVGVAASIMLGGPGVAALSGRALATTSKATSKAAEATRALGQNGSRAANGADDLAQAAFREDVSHIFRNAPGHMVDDTPANRLLLQETVSPGNLVGTRSLGPNGALQKFERTLPNGDVVWVEVRNGTTITNGGVNVAAPTS